jgi:hypothetical protein
MIMHSFLTNFLMCLCKSIGTKYFLTIMLYFLQIICYYQGVLTIDKKKRVARELGMTTKPHAGKF